MRRFVPFLAAIAIALALAPFAGLRMARRGPRRASRDRRMDVYRVVRDAAFRTPRTDAGVILDWAFEGGNGTLVALAGGRLNLYLSDPGCLEAAAGNRPSVRGAAGRFQSERETAGRLLQAAAECRPYAHPAQAWPLPQRGEVNVYLLTGSGILAVSASESALTDSRHPLAKLRKAGRDVLAEFGCPGMLP